MLKNISAKLKIQILIGIIFTICLIVTGSLSYKNFHDESVKNFHDKSEETAYIMSSSISNWVSSFSNYLNGLAIGLEKGNDGEIKTEGLLLRFKKMQTELNTENVFVGMSDGRTFRYEYTSSSIRRTKCCIFSNRWKYK